MGANVRKSTDNLEMLIRRVLILLRRVLSSIVKINTSRNRSQSVVILVNIPSITLLWTTDVLILGGIYMFMYVVFDCHYNLLLLLTFKCNFCFSRNTWCN